MSEGGRPAAVDRLIITIDGPAGTGKSTVAQRLAARLGVEVLDTGAMYRAVALIAIEQSFDPQDGDALVPAIARADLHFDWSREPPAVCLGDRDVSDRIRDRDVAAIVSAIAAVAPVRAALVSAQQRIAREHPRLVTEGRDQGSIVFPDATVRFFLDAHAAVRAERRTAQLAERGTIVDPAAIEREIIARDERDVQRSDGPLICPDGAIVVDTTALSIDDVVDTLAAAVAEHRP